MTGKSPARLYNAARDKATFVVGIRNVWKMTPRPTVQVGWDAAVQLNVNKWLETSN